MQLYYNKYNYSLQVGIKNRSYIWKEGIFRMKTSMNAEAIGSKYYPDTQNWSNEQKLQFMNENDGLIIALVAKYSYLKDCSMDREDLYQVASEAFWNAFFTYNPEKGTRFTTYIQILMKNEINELLRWSNAQKRMPLEIPISYDAIVKDGEEWSGGENIQILEFKESVGTLSIEDQILQKELKDVVYRLLRNYKRREQYIFLSLVYKLKSQVELAKELNCSQAKISTDYNRIRRSLQNDLQEIGY